MLVAWGGGEIEMKSLITYTVLIVAGIEYGCQAYDKMSASINADLQHKIQLMQDARAL